MKLLRIKHQIVFLLLLANSIFAMQASDEEEQKAGDSFPSFYRGIPDNVIGLSPPSATSPGEKSDVAATSDALRSLWISGRFDEFKPRLGSQEAIAEQEALIQNRVEKDLEEKLIEYYATSRIKIADFDRQEHYITPRFRHTILGQYRKQALEDRNQIINDLEVTREFLARNDLNKLEKKNLGPKLAEFYSVGSFELAKDEFMPERNYVDHSNHVFAVIDANLQLDRNEQLMTNKNDHDMAHFIFSSLELATSEQCGGLSFLPERYDLVLKSDVPDTYAQSGASLSVVKINPESYSMSLSHIGNSRIVTSYDSGSRVFQFSEDHSPANYEEADRIDHNDREFIFDAPYIDRGVDIYGRFVQDSFCCPQKFLKATRAIGHQKWDKSFIPSVGQYEKSISLALGLDVIIIASDSFWQQLDPVRAVHLVHQTKNQFFAKYKHKFNGVISSNIAKFIATSIAKKLIDKNQAQSMALTIIFINKR